MFLGLRGDASVGDGFSARTQTASLGVPLLAMGVPIFDTMLAIWRRTVRAMLPQGFVGSGTQTHVMQPDKEHHHRLLRKTMNQRTAAIILYGGSAGAGCDSDLRVRCCETARRACTLLAFIVAISVVVRHLERVELWDTGRLLSRRR